MEFKVKHILVIATLVILGLISFIVRSIKNSQNITIEETKEYEINENKIGFNSYEDTENLIMQIAIKDGNWSNLLLTDNFKSKYNEKDGVLGKLQFDKIEYKPYNEGRYPFEDRTYFVITQGLKKTAYTFNLIGKNGYIDDIKYFEIFDLTDENGQELDARVTINKDNFTRIFHMLSRGEDDEKSVAVTDAFHRKYPYFLDLFIHYSPLGANEITFKSEKSSWEKKEAYFEVDSIYECIKRHYIVNFKIDSRGYLDDAKVKLVGEYPYDKGRLVEASSQVFYKKSNWNYLKLSDNFKNKYKDKESVYESIDELNIDEITFGLFYNDDVNTLINKYKTKNGNNRWLCEKYTYINKDYLDDAEILPIDYDGEDIEEAKRAYIKQYEH